MHSGARSTRCTPFSLFFSLSLSCCNLKTKSDESVFKRKDLCSLAGFWILEHLLFGCRDKVV